MLKPLVFDILGTARTLNINVKNCNHTVSSIMNPAQNK